MPYNVTPRQGQNGARSVPSRDSVYPHPPTPPNYSTDFQSLYNGVLLDGSSRPDFFQSIFDPESVYDYETAQNAKLAMMMADYNSPENAMKRAQAAGINPNTAAAALAGGSSAEAPNPAQSAQGQAAKTLEGLFDAAVGGANAAAALSQASTAAKIAPSSINLNDATARKALADAGFSEASTDGILIDNYYKDSHHIADLAIKRQNVENMKMDWEYVSKQKDYLQKEIDSYDERIKAAIDLQEKQALEAEKRAKEADAHARSMELENDFFNKYGFHSDSPTDVALRNVWQLEGASERYKGMLDAAYNVHYNIAYGSAVAGANASWLSRPESAAAIAAQTVHDGRPLVDKALDKLVKGEELSKEDCKALYSREELRDGYDDYRTYLRQVRKMKWTGYRDASVNGWNNIQEKYDAYKAADDEYKNMTFDKWLGSGGLLTHQPIKPVTITNP